MMKLVDQLFDYMFEDLFQEAEKDRQESTIDCFQLIDSIDEKLGDDAMAQPLKDMFDSAKTPDLTREMIREALTKLCSKQLIDFNPDEDPSGVT